MSQLEPAPKGRHYMASKGRGVFEVEILSGDSQKILQQIAAQRTHVP